MTSEPNEAQGSEGKRRVLIGSQKDPAAYRPRRDWTTTQPNPEEAATDSPAAVEPPAPPPVPAAEPAPAVTPPASVAAPVPPASAPAEPPHPPRAAPFARPGALASAPADETTDVAEVYEPPLPPVIGEWKDEFEADLDDAALDEFVSGALVARSEAVSRQGLIEPDSRQVGRVVVVQRDDVFVELGSREQGVVSVRQFPEPPAPGVLVEVVVQRFNPEEGLYELRVPGASAVIGDWSDIREGMVVEAKVTGSNTGGLECEVNHIRAFIPAGQAALYHIENLADLVGQKFPTIVLEANPDRRKLVLSRRAVLEREKEESRQKLLGSLAVGDTRDGVVRKLMDFGAFVDLGGIDGLIHVSQLSWSRVKHPNEVVQEGQQVKVKIVKIDPATGKLGLSLRDVMESPWTGIERKYPPNAAVRGTVTRLMEFGAFVQIEPGVEGLVHISELSAKRVSKASSVVSEGQEVEVVVLSVDAENQRMSLSMKAAVGRAAEAAEDAAAEEAAAALQKRKKPSGPLKGGLGGPSGGERFGLRW